MRIYIRKLFPHDITHEISIKMDTVNEFFENNTSMSFRGIKSGRTGTVTINSPTDPRLGGAVKSLILEEGGADIDDLLVVYKHSSISYSFEICRPDDERYAVWFPMFENKERHLKIYTEDETNSGTSRVYGAENILLYGVPGSGKSHTLKTKYCNDQKYMQRVVFHPDYTYSDFVGQIMPVINETQQLEYKFVQGPFTKILKKAVEDKNNYYYLVIEELNRGNAPAIFGEIFQLLDRYDSNSAEKPDMVGESEYGITNFDVAREVYGDASKEIKLPSNLYILATMNTADQNVFTMDTAFQRRWNMKPLENDFKAGHSDYIVDGTNVSWGAFATTINDIVIETSNIFGSSEDKRLGAYFAKVSELKKDRFPGKVLKYLWDDAFKMNRKAVFKDEMKTLSDVISAYELSNDDRMAAVIRAEVYQRMISKMPLD